MFKQQQKDETNNFRQKTQRREEGLGIKVISNWIDDRKGSNASQTKREHGRSPILKTDTHPQQPSRVPSTRGIKVISSRQSSTERPQLDSRSNSRQKQSKQIKSQTNISDFDSVGNSKEPSLQRQQITKYIDQESIIESIQHRFKQAILKQKTMHEAQVAQLRQIIFNNQQRIDNLIATLNQLVEGGQRKEKGLGRLQSRLNSNQKYAQQSYQYTVNRCKDSEIALRHISEEIHNNSIKNIEIQNKMQYIQRIIIDIFTVQRTLVYQQQANFLKEIRKMQQSLSKLQEKLIQLQRLELKHSLQDMKSVNWKEHIIQLRQKFQNYANRKQSINQSDVNKYGWINKEQLAIKMQNIELKIVQLQNAKKILQDEYKQKQQTSQHAIWQLSSLLNKQQRQLQKIQKQNISLLSYNKQIENKLIESKHRENSMHSFMQSQLKALQTSVINQQNSRILAENEVFRQKYEELLRHKHYLQDINCKNKLQLMNQGKIMQQLHEKLKEQKMNNKGEEIIRLQYKIVSLEQEIQGLKRKLSEANRKIEQRQSQIFAKSMELQAITVQLTTLKSQIHENSYKIQKLHIQISEIQAQNGSLSEQLDKVRKEQAIVQKQLQEQQLYSQHLQKQNQKLEIQIQQYTKSFEQQSQMFKTVIDRLKKQRQRQQLRYNEPKTDRPISSNYSQQSSKTSLLSNTSITKAQQQKLLRLKKAIDAAGYKKPVPCQIDGRGYLKHLDQGTYIFDAHQNLFQLSTQEKHLAIKTNLIQLFQ